MAFYQLNEVFGYQDANLIKALWASTTTPTGAETGEVWLDTSLTPSRLKRYNGTSWDVIGDMTATEILTLLKTVDGSGSGLDADKLDNKESSVFVQTTSDQTVAGNKTFTANLIVSEQLVIPQDQPTSLLNGSIWIV